MPMIPCCLCCLAAEELKSAALKKSLLKPILSSMGATIINAAAVFAGAVIGLLFAKRIPSSLKTILMTSAGVVTIILGIDMAMEGEVLPILFALIFGGFIGFWIRIDERVSSIGSGNGSTFGKGFLDSSVLFCSGALSIVGSINAGTAGDWELILIKSVMDGFMAIIFAAMYGKGVLLSAVSILVYQGFFTIAGSAIAPALGESGINAMAAAGGYLLIMIALGLLELKSVKTANFLPALVLAPVFTWIYGIAGL